MGNTCYSAHVEAIEQLHGVSSVGPGDGAYSVQYLFPWRRLASPSLFSEAVLLPCSIYIVSCPCLSLDPSSESQDVVAGIPRSCPVFGQHTLLLISFLSLILEAVGFTVSLLLSVRYILHINSFQGSGEWWGLIFISSQGIYNWNWA